MADDFWIHTDEGQHWLNCVREAGGGPAARQSTLDFLAHVVWLATGRRV